MYMFYNAITIGLHNLLHKPSAIGPRRVSHKCWRPNERKRGNPTACRIEYFSLLYCTYMYYDYIEDLTWPRVTDRFSLSRGSPSLGGSHEWPQVTSDYRQEMGSRVTRKTVSHSGPCKILFLLCFMVKFTLKTSWRTSTTTPFWVTGSVAS